MRSRLPLAALLAAGLTLPTLALAAPQEIRGAKILEHPCGKLSVQHMGLVHAGKIDEAFALGSKELQAQWKAAPAADRKMMAGMMQATSQTEADYTAAIKAGGVLVVDGATAKLTVTEEKKDANGTMTSTQSQSFSISGTTCTITD